jgi:hypothetical protein
MNKTNTVAQLTEETSTVGTGKRRREKQRRKKAKKEKAAACQAKPDLSKQSTGCLGRPSKVERLASSSDSIAYSSLFAHFAKESFNPLIGLRYN